MAWRRLRRGITGRRFCETSSPPTGRGRRVIATRMASRHSRAGILGHHFSTARAKVQEPTTLSPSQRSASFDAVSSPSRRTARPASGRAPMAAAVVRLIGPDMPTSGLHVSLESVAPACRDRVWWSLGLIHSLHDYDDAMASVDRARSSAQLDPSPQPGP